MSRSPRPYHGSTELAASRRSPAHTTIDRDDPSDLSGGDRAANTLAAAVHAEIERLETLDLHDLRIRYRQLTRKTAPPHLPRWLLLRIVVYRLQAKAFGDLDAEALKFLARVAKALEADKRKRSTADDGKEKHSRRKGVPPVPPVEPKTRFKPGTLLVREHAGELHRVMVMEQGFAWNGATYGSLSEVARAITGTVWNGPYFFGLRAKKRDAARGDDSGAIGDDA